MLKLTDSVIKIPKVGPKNKLLLEKLGIFSVGDLVYHIPQRYEKFSKKKISELIFNEKASVNGVLISINNIFTRNRKKLTKAIIKDESGKMEAIWFNMHYLSKSLEVGEMYEFTGLVGSTGSKLNFISPSVKKVDINIKNDSEVNSVYPLTEGVTSNFLREKILFSLENLEIEEFFPREILEKYNFLPLKETLKELHFPSDIEKVTEIRERLEFEELFLELLTVESRKNNWKEKLNSHIFESKTQQISKLEKSLPFNLTDSQKRSIDEISKDLLKPTPMNRLLEGDVGTGKTLVAVFASYLTYLNQCKIVYLAPTEILAKQHFATFQKYLEPLGVKVLLKTGSTKKKIGETEFDVIIGTHAILFDDSELTMTATPIPRTFALTLYGDLEISILDAPPNKDKKITTFVIYPNKRDDMYKWILEKNEPAFIVCPFISESENEDFSQVKSAEKEFETLSQGIFKNKKVGLLHGKMKAKEKDEILSNFRDQKIDILVSTPVIEVGVDIPDANIMVIESAERYGLASLHQLRGRVGRGQKEGFCIVIPSTGSKKSMERLKNLEKYNNGLELAEVDLKLRGEGDIYGKMQSGFKNFRFADISNLKLLEKAKHEASKIFADLEKYPKLKKIFEQRSFDISLGN
ncbi:ATP-dependent DNA helicase RecG [bacterium]|nr:ATP-dependent DNA helicase RecG [bacterium]